MGYEPLTIVFVRMAMAFIIMFAALIILGKRDLLRIRLKDIWCFIGSGGSCALLLNLFLSISTVMNTLSLAAILLATSPVFVVLLSAPIFHERITPVKVQAMVIAFAGCVFVSGAIGNGAVFSAPGIVIGLIAGVGIAMNSIFLRFGLNRGYSPLTVSLYSFGFGSLLSAPFTNYALIAFTISDAPLNMTVLLLLHTLCTLLIPYVLFAYGMKVLDTGKAAIFASVEPVAASVLGAIIYSEIPAPINVFGIALVLFAIVLLNIPGGLRTLLRK